MFQTIISTHKLYISDRVETIMPAVSKKIYLLMSSYKEFGGHWQLLHCKQKLLFRHCWIVVQTLVLLFWNSVVNGHSFCLSFRLLLHHITCSILKGEKTYLIQHTKNVHMNKKDKKKALCSACNYDRCIGCI